MIRIVGFADDRVSERASGICQVATHTNSVEHSAYCEQCRDLAAILPKLKHPGYVKLIGAEMETPTLSISDVRMSKLERKKKAKSEHKSEVMTRATTNRVARLLSGAFVRTRPPNNN
jgi:hypothetical protein